MVNSPALGYFWSPYSLVYDPIQIYINKALVLWKGRNYVCDKNLGLFRVIDLSSNKLQGEIPRELTSLSELKQLNSSNNKLKGPIPREIGSLKKVESLDLSQNHLSGRIPTSMAGLTFLGYFHPRYLTFRLTTTMVPNFQFVT